MWNNFSVFYYFGLLCLVHQTYSHLRYAPQIRMHTPPPVHPTSIILIKFPFFVHSCLSPCLATPFLSPLLSSSDSFICQRFLNPVISPPFPPQPHTALAVLASETKGKMKAFVLQWLCIWCQSGSLFIMVQTVIRVYPYKELLPLMGLVWIYNWQTHTFSVVGGG